MYERVRLGESILEGKRFVCFGREAGAAHLIIETGGRSVIPGRPARTLG